METDGCLRSGFALPPAPQLIAWYVGRTAQMTTAGDLCERGFLPAELPPPFSSRSFGALVRTGWNPTPPRSSSGVSHNLFRWGSLRRPLTIPNPLAFVGLAREIETQWANLQPVIRLSPWSLTRPIISTVRAVEREHDHRILLRARASSRAGHRYALRADVSRFYHSIYTHTLEWAVHTKAAVKANRALPGAQRQHLWGCALDDRHRALQDSQSVGIPIGPDTSLIAAELLLARVDHVLSQTARCDGFRYLDDYELSFTSLADAEGALSALQAALAEYKLALNPNKTSIFELPAPLEAPWTRTLRRIRVRAAGSGQRFDFVDLFDAAFELRREVPDAHVLRFAMGQARHATCLPQNWPVIQAIYLQAMSAEPGIIREVLAELLRYRALGRVLDVQRIAYTLSHVVTRHAALDHGSEVAWALWAHIQLNIPLDNGELDSAERMSDPIVALICLDAAARQLTPRAPASAVWSAMMSVAELTGPGWLLAYEAAIKGWLPGAHVAQNQDFLAMQNAQVEFYEVLAAPQHVPITVGGGGGGVSP